jgi:hypothetical protein
LFCCIVPTNKRLSVSVVRCLERLLRRTSSLRTLQERERRWREREEDWQKKKRKEEQKTTHAEHMIRRSAIELTE